MSFENPTRLRIGMHGNFDGRDYRLIGRVVMGESEDGETYYWNEFNLHADDGSYADLVYEETEGGGQWKLFTMFEPEYPLTAADAGTKRVGDQLNLTGDDVRVSFCGSSRVYRIEGTAPEGVEVGDAANYFNAEAGSLMQVVSWTGDEVEYYNGVQLSPLVVASAFNLPRATQAKLSSALSGESATNSTDYTSGLKFILQAGLVLIVFLLVFGRSLSCSTAREASPIKPVPASPAPLTTGATGTWQEKNLRITAHAVVEIAETGAIFERHEYTLSDGTNAPALLVCGLQPGQKEWTLFTPLLPLLPPTARQSAAEKTGDRVNVDGVVATVGELFQSTIHAVDSVDPTDWRNGEVNFGYLGRGDYFSLLVRWNSADAWFYRGKPVTPKEVIAAFAGTPSP